MGRDAAHQATDIINAVLSGAGTTSAVIPFDNAHSISLTLTADPGSTLAATLSIEASDNYDPRRPSEARWATITDAAIVAFLGAAFGTGMKPNGAAGAGKLQIDPLRTAALRYNIVWVSGSGRVHLDALLA